MAIQISGTTVIDNSRNVINTGYVEVGSFTTAQRDALSVPVGTVLYNSSTNKQQAYFSGGWVDMI